MSELPPTDKTSDDCDLCFIVITPPDWMKQKQGDPSIADPKVQFPLQQGEQWAAEL